MIKLYKPLLLSGSQRSFRINAKELRIINEPKGLAKIKIILKFQSPLSYKNSF